MAAQVTMLTLKVGTLMSKEVPHLVEKSQNGIPDNIVRKNSIAAMKETRNRVFGPSEVISANRAVHLRYRLLTAFTFVEVIAALAIVSISLLALIKLHVVSISMADTAEITSQAVFLADEKIAETLALGYPKEGTYSGTVEKNALLMHWQTEVTELQLPQLDEVDITGLRRVFVDVSWEQGISRKHLQMSTYVADRKLP